TYDMPPASGTMTVSVDGQQQVFNAPFTNSPQAYTITGLTSDGMAKTVTVVFSDDGSCTNTADYTAPVNCLPVSCTLVGTNVTCNGASTGQLVATGAGGTGSYQFSLNGGAFQSSGTFTGLAAGMYTVTVRDANNQANTSTCMETITEPLPITCAITTFTNPSTAGGSDGSLTAEGMGGSGSYQFSLNGGAFQSSGTFTGLSAGMYTVTVRDVADNSCTSTCMVELADGCGVSITANPGDCDPITNEYTLTGTLTFSEQPTTGTLTVSVDGEQQVFNAPFTSPQGYSIGGLNSDGTQKTVTVAFSDDVNCMNSTTYMAPIDCKPCNLVLGATPGTCDPASNTYELSGSITFEAAPTSGTLTVNVAGQTQVFSAPFTSPQAFTITGLASDGQPQVVVAQFSAEPTCQSSLSYDAPEPCGDAMNCTVDVTAVPGDCDPATGTYELSGEVTFSDAPATGTMTVAVGAFQEVFNAPFISPANYNLTGLVADGSSSTVTVTFSANPSCLDNANFNAPIGCDPVDCNISLTATPGACDPASNTYDLTGSISFTNAPATGQLVVRTNGGQVSFDVATISSPKAFTISDLFSGGGSRIVSAYFTADPGCLSNFFYRAPEPCGGAMVCSSELAVTPTPCSDGTYALEGTIQFENAPSTGTVTVSEGGITLLTISLPASSPQSFVLPGLTADGASHTLELQFSEDASCNTQTTYDAPAPCVDPCSLSATIENTNCNDNNTPTDPSDDYLTFTLNPGGDGLGTGYTVTASAGNVFTLAGGSATNMPYGSTTTFRLANGSAGAGNVTISVADATNPVCTDSGTLVDPGVCSEPVCSMVLSATPSDCDPATGNYSIAGNVTFDNAPATGSLVVYVDGVASATFPVASASSPQAFSIFDLASDGASHVLTAEFTADQTCMAELTYLAPMPCGTASGCTVSVTAVPGTCESPDSEYDLTGEVSFTAAPATGTMTVAVGPYQQVFSAPFTSPQAYQLNDLSASGNISTVTVTFSADPNCRNSTTYAAPSACTPDVCSLDLTATAGACASATNTYDISGELTFTDAPSSGSLTVTANGVSQTFSAPFTSPQVYSLTGLIADGNQVRVNASFSADANCAAADLVDAPDSCGPDQCALELAVSPTPCADGTYTLGGTLTFVEAPTTGTLIIREGSTDLLTIGLPANSPLGFAIPGLIADGQTHNLIAFFSADGSCSDPVSYDAPASCVGPCDVMATVMNIECNDNGTIIDGVDDYITFSLNPTGTNTGNSYSVSSSAGQVFRLDGSPATGILFGTETYFRMQNGSAGAGDVTITVDDDDSPACTTSAGLVDPGDCEVDLYLDLALTKVINTSATPGPYNPGDPVTFTIEVFNQGLVQAVNIELTDYFPAELILNDPNWTANGQTATLNDPIATLDVNTNTTRDITFTISDEYEGICLVNWAEISAADPSFLQGVLYDIDSDPDNMQFNSPGETDDLDDDNVIDEDGKNGGDEDDHDPAKVEVENVFDLALLKTESGIGPFVPGGDINFLLYVRNQGTVDAQNVQVTDYIPAGLTLNDPRWTETSPGKATLNTPIAEVLVGRVSTVGINFTIDSDYQGATITNWAEISSAENVPNLPDIDSTPDDEQFNSPGETDDLDDDNVNNEDGMNGGDEDDHDPALIPLEQTFDLALRKTVLGTGPFMTDETVTFAIEVINQGSLDAQNIQISDYIPAGLILTDAAWTNNGGIAMLNTPIASLAANASTTVNITFTIDVSFTGVSIRNWAEISSAENLLDEPDVDSTPDNEQFNGPEETDDLDDDDVVEEDGFNGGDEDDHDPAEIEVIQNFDLALLKNESSIGPYFPGDLVMFAFLVDNQGSLTANNIQITDYIPDGLILEDPQWTEVNGKATLINPIATLTPGAVASRTITFRISPDFQGTSIRNWGEISSAENDVNAEDVDSTPDDEQFNSPGETDDMDDDDVDNEDGMNGGDEDDHDPAEITVEQTFDLALTKVLNTTATPGPFGPGSTVTFTVEIFNQGTLNATDIQVTDYIPTGLTLADANWMETTPGKATLNTPIASLAANRSTTVDITFTIDSDFTGTALTNIAEISGASNLPGVPDEDSTPDDTNDDMIGGDNVTDEDGLNGGDEDDHD
ncbi:MAG: DUF11 domain-containing protein, partial [Bacteroidetes bacterium]